jgi:membrane protein
MQMRRLINIYKLLKNIDNLVDKISGFIKRYFICLYLSIFNVSKIPKVYLLWGIIFLIINFIALNLISMHLELDSITGVILTIASKDISNISPVTKIWSIKFLSFLLGNFIFSVLFSILIYRLSKIKITVSSVLGASGFAAFSGYIYFLFSGILSIFLFTNDSIISNLEVVNQLLNNTSSGSIDDYIANVYLSYVNIYEATILHQYNFILACKFGIFLFTIIIWWKIIFGILKLDFTCRNIISFVSSILIIGIINIVIIVGSNYENIKLFYSQSTMYSELVDRVKTIDSDSNKDYNKLNILTNILAEDSRLSHKTRYSLYVYSILYEELYISQLSQLQSDSNTKEIFTDVTNLDTLDKVLLIEENNYNFYKANAMDFSILFDATAAFDEDVLSFNDHLNLLSVKLTKAHEMRKLINDNEVDEKLSIFTKFTYNLQHNILTLDLLAI